MTQSRDRDEHGRPRNARPRDPLGRPLPRHAQGADPQPEPVYVSAVQTLDSAQRLLDAGRPFHAHEVLEAAWKNAPANESDLWQGLAQLAVGLTHALRDNRAGAAALLRRGRGRIADYASAPPHDIDVAGLMVWADRLIAQLEAPGHKTPAIPALRAVM